ncbi:POLR2I isoform 6 [Pongo abelii]|uniref:POLR2I isoform 6 n=1 Tax=Pongo abelii TaxID=9601 RepID=A0A2J8RRZ7_PONAB|nr:POLR2I isoform 6 [Pongo abelii]
MEPDGTYEPGFVVTTCCTPKKTRRTAFCSTRAGTVITSRRPTTAASMSTRSLTKWTN